MVFAMSNGVLYEDEAVVIRFRPGFLENPDAFEVGEGVEHVYNSKEKEEGMTNTGSLLE